MSEKLIELSEGWVWTNLGELGEWSSGGTPSRKNIEYFSGEIPWVKTGDLPDGLIKKIEETITQEGLANSSAKIFPKGSLVLAMYGATIGKLGILAQPAATNQACAVLLSKGVTTDLIPYLFYYLLDSREDLRMIGQGGAQPNINQAIIKEYSCPLPPLNEQKRIVAKIEELNDRTQKAKEALEAIPQLCDRFRQSVLAAAFRGDLTADWRVENPDVEPASVLLERITKNSQAEIQDKRKPQELKYCNIDPSNLPKVPANWVWSHLQILGELTRGKSKHRPRNDPKLFDGKYPFIQTGDIARANGRITKHSQTYNEIGLLQSRLFPSGTVCITIAANIADTAVLAYPACFPDSVVGFIPQQGMFEAVLAMYYIKLIQSDLEIFAPATAQKNINLEILYEVAVPVPPIDEQREIVKLIDSLFKTTENVEQQYQKAKSQLNHLNQSILSKAFRGELAPQDPDDEPAYVLLERIRAEREKLNNSKPKSNRTSKGKRNSKIPEGQESIPGLE